MNQTSEENFYKMLEGKMTALVTCRQFGDTGKGKIVDFLARWADVIIRGTGGDNAGHTICFDGQKIVTHIIPSGIVHPGKINIIGNNVVLYPKAFCDEMAALVNIGISFDKLMVAYNAHLITPAQILWDRLSEVTAGSGKIGSTGKGIGPAYSDFVARRGLMVGDLLNPEIFREKLSRHLKFYRHILSGFDMKIVKEIMFQEHLESGFYYDDDEIFNIDNIYKKYIDDYGRIMERFICDTDAFVKANLGKLKILGEGAQGDLLSINRGTYPYVTSSDCTAAGLAAGMGLKEGDIDLSIGIIKGFYMTRVGCGAFPTEIGGEESDKWCNCGQTNKINEKGLYGHCDVNQVSGLAQGVMIRIIGDEYGATTGRPRRVGWLDLPLLRYTLKFNSQDIFLTKLDILNTVAKIKICYAYQYVGKTIKHGDDIIKSGQVLYEAITDNYILSRCKPLYMEFDGWQTNDLGDCYDNLPDQMKTILNYIVSETKINILGISVGADREEIIWF